MDCSVGGNADCVAAAGVGGRCGFAGKRDWRVPNVKELQSIINYEVFSPAVSPAFNNNCVAGATVQHVSCTAPSPSFYWSSTVAFGSDRAWVVDFGGGDVFVAAKLDTWHVRAVRGGSP